MPLHEDCTTYNIVWINIRLCSQYAEKQHDFYFFYISKHEVRDTANKTRLNLTMSSVRFAPHIIFPLEIVSESILSLVCSYKKIFACEKYYVARSM